MNSCPFKSAVNPASQSLTIETSDLCARLGKKHPSHASAGKAGKLIKHGFLASMDWPFGNPT